MTQLKVVTVATDAKFYFNYLKETIHDNNNELIVLGYGEKWQGFTWRYKIMLEYLHTLNLNDIVCVVDGYDVICTRNLNELTEIFYKIKKEQNCKIIVGCETHMNFFLQNFIVPTFFGSCKNMPLNAGTYIGCVKDLISIFSELNITDNMKDDQVMLIDYCKTNPSDIYIDKKSEIFLTIANYHGNIDNDLIIKDKKVYYHEQQPFFIHGFNHSYMDNILIKLGYTNVDVISELKKGMYENILFKLKSMIYNFLFTKWILFFVLLVIVIYLFKNKKLKYKIRKLI